MIQLSSLDNIFAQAERPHLPMHVSAVSIYDPSTSSQFREEVPGATINEDMADALGQQITKTIFSYMENSSQLKSLLNSKLVRDAIRVWRDGMSRYDARPCLFPGVPHLVLRRVKESAAQSCPEK